MFSMMACATIGGALVGDLLFLPALLKWMIRSPTDLLGGVRSDLEKEQSDHDASERTSGRPME